MSVVGHGKKAIQIDRGCIKHQVLHVSTRMSVKEYQKQSHVNQKNVIGISPSI